MVSWDCSNCGGSGKEKVVEIRNSQIKEYEGKCSGCDGYGILRNGKPSTF